MTIIGRDPFQLLAYQQAMISAPLTADAAAGNDPLDTQQRAIVIGEPIPVVFCRRVGDVGGVLISPGATEARFENDASNNLTARWRLVLGEGQMAGIQVRDVFQRSCRVGSFTQSFERRAGNWTPGNFIVDRVGYTRPEAPIYCGTGGTYEGMTTASFTITTPDGSDQWNRQVHVFVRGGINVPRFADGLTGPSNNVADLVQWLLSNTGRVPAELVDATSLAAAGAFTDAMGFRFDGELKTSQNLDDWLSGHLKYFLLQKSRKGGKFGLRPLLPVGDDNLISTDPVTPAYVFDEAQIAPDSFEISYTPLSDRKPICALMLWRQQPDNDIGLIRTTEVRYARTAADGPFEQHDLSSFCCSELHAVRVGAYILARRRHVTHTLRLRFKPGDWNATISRGDIVQVQLNRRTSITAATVHSYFYEVDTIRRARTGAVTLELTHFPVNADGVSLVALDVMSAQASGILLPTGKSVVVSCDTNSSTDTNVPPEESLDPIDWADTPYEDAFAPVDDGTGTGGVPGSGIGGTGGTWGGSGGGGGNESSGSSETEPAPGTPLPAVYPIDTQAPPPDVSVPPTGVGVGQNAPQSWIDEWNAQNPNSGDTPWPTDWAVGNYQWTMVFRVTSYPWSVNTVTGQISGGSGTRTWTFDNISTMVNAFGGYITTIPGDRMSVTDARIVFGDPLTGTVYGGGLAVWFRLDPGWFVSWVIAPTAPTIEMVSVTRTA